MSLHQMYKRGPNGDFVERTDYVSETSEVVTSTESRKTKSENFSTMSSTKITGTKRPVETSDHEREAKKLALSEKTRMTEQDFREASEHYNDMKYVDRVGDEQDFLEGVHDEIRNFTQFVAAEYSIKASLEFVRKFLKEQDVEVGKIRFDWMDSCFVCDGDQGEETSFTFAVEVVGTKSLSEVNHSSLADLFGKTLSSEEDVKNVYFREWTAQDDSVIECLKLYRKRYGKYLKNCPDYSWEEEKEDDEFGDKDFKYESDDDM